MGIPLNPDPHSIADSGRRAWTLLRGLFLGAGTLCAALLPHGCSTTHFKESADKEVYGIVAEKTPAVAGMEDAFTLDRERGWEPLAGLPLVEEVYEPLGDDAKDELGAAIIGFEKALDIAVKNSRAYQTEKENLYLEALALTSARYEFAPIFRGRVSGNYNRFIGKVLEDQGGSKALASGSGGIDDLINLAGTPTQLLKQYADLVEGSRKQNDGGGGGGGTEVKRTVGGDTSFGVDMLLKGGGRIALELTSNFLRFVTGDNPSTSSSSLAASFTQPLLRGAGTRVTIEFLTQAERDVLYRLRRFTRFRKEFTVDICASYYNVLQNRDIVRNRWIQIQSLKVSEERERQLQLEGRSTIANVGRQESARLNAENLWINAVRRYKDSLDRFKIDLGLSTDARVVLDDVELDLLHEKGVDHPDIAIDDAAEVALATRLDLMNDRDQIEDAGRRVYVQANALKADLGLIISGSADSVGENNFDDFDFSNGRWSAGFDLDLPLDRKDERNEYRAALIALDRAERDYTLAVDNVKFDVRTAWYELDQAKLNYEISLNSVRTNELRVEEQDEKALVGRATTIDQVDAQNDLTSSQNDVTAALVRHTIARLAFWRDMGILYIKEGGQWETPGIEQARNVGEALLTEEGKS